MDKARLQPSSPGLAADHSEDELIEDFDGDRPPVVHSTRSDDDDDELGEAACIRDTGFFDWYGDPSRHDHLCRGRREAVIGSELVADYAHQPYQWPPLSRLQAAILSGGLVGEDPSSEKKQRWGYDDSWQDELHSIWTDELDLARVGQSPGTSGSRSHEPFL